MPKPLGVNILLFCRGLVSHVQNNTRCNSLTVYFIDQATISVDRRVYFYFDTGTFSIHC